MRRLQAELGTSTTEVALMLPVLTALILWSNFMWDVGRKKIKVLETARYAAWEMAAYQGSFGKGTGAIRSETLQRFADLDSTSPTGTPQNNMVGFNELQIQVNLSLADSVTDESVDGAGGLVQNAMGTAVKPIFRSLVGGGRLNTQVTSQVTFSVRNKLLPPSIAGTALRDPLQFTTRETLIYDTWAAWRPGDAPSNSLGVAKRRIKRALEDSNGIVTFPLIGAIVGDGTFVGNAMDAVLGVLDIPWALDIEDQYVQLSPRTLRNDITGSYGVSSKSAAMPGRLYENKYWTGNGRGPPESGSRTRNYSGVLNDSQKYYRADVNRHVRVENCRGNYYYGSTLQEATYYKYNINNTNACTQSTRPYQVDEIGTRKGLRRTGFGGLKIE